MERNCINSMIQNATMNRKLQALICAIFSFVFISNAQSWKELNDSLKFYENKGDYKKSLSFAEKAKLVAQKEFGELDSNYATSLYNLASSYQGMSNYSKAEPLLLEAMNIYRKVLGTEYPNYADILNNLANLFYSMGNYTKAEPLHIEAMNIRRKTLGEEHPDYATSLNNLAFLYYEMGKYAKVKPLLVEAMNIYKKTLGEENPNYALSLNNQAVLYYRMGNYAKAEPLFVEAMNIRRKALGEEHPDYALSLTNLAALLQTIGNYTRAEPLLVESMNIRKKTLGEENPNYAFSLNSLAVLYQRMGNYTKAEPLFVEAMNIRKKVLGEEHPNYAASLNSLAVLYYKIGNYAKAEPLFVEAMNIRRKVLGEEHTDYATSLNNVALLYQRNEQYTKAEPLFVEAINIRRKVLGEEHPDYATNLNNLALLYQSFEQYTKAEPLFLQNSSIVIKNLKSIFSILSENEKQTFLQNIVSLSGTENSFLYHHREVSPHIKYVFAGNQLFFKGLVLDDSKNILASLNQTRDTIVQNLYDNWLGNKKILSKQYSLPVAKRRADLKEFEAKTEGLEKELNRRSAAFRSVNETFETSPAHVHKQLKKEETAIEFVSFNLYNKKESDNIIYAAYVFTSKDTVPVFVPLFEEKQLQRIIDSAGTSSEAMVSKFYRGVELGNTGTAASLGTDLYNLVWAPLEPYLKGIKKISYSPAGKLYSIAFHALPVDSNKILMDKYELNQYTSTRQVALRKTQEENRKPQSISLFGDARFTMDSTDISKSKTNNTFSNIYTPPNRGNRGNSWTDLPGTAEEVKKIKQLFEQNKISTKSFTQTAASEENLKALSGNSPQILHIATHGFFLPEPDKKRKENFSSNDNTYTLADDPLLRSGLILSGGNYAWSGKTPIEGAEDGIATAYEISQLNLSNTELVVLSACETALGDVKGSEGVFGLQRAFKMAGVKKMIVSLWQVPDKETAELMTAFYGYWLKGKTIEQAFKQAQAAMRKKYSPYYWAAFVLVE